MSAKIRPGRRAELLDAIESGRFGAGFPYGNLGETLKAGRVGPEGTVRWVEVCYCREYYDVAMEEELPYFEEFLTDLTVADARDPADCIGYPACGSCDCTDRIRPKGVPFLDFLRQRIGPDVPDEGRPTRWLGWRGSVTPTEAERNRLGAAINP